MITNFVRSYCGIPKWQNLIFLLFLCGLLIAVALPGCAEEAVSYSKLTVGTKIRDHITKDEVKGYEFLADSTSNYMVLMNDSWPFFALDDLELKYQTGSGTTCTDALGAQRDCKLIGVIPNRENRFLITNISSGEIQFYLVVETY